MTTETFLYTGNSVSWTVPTNVSSISVEVIGGGGSGNIGNLGGNGGNVTATLPVETSDVLTIVVGGGGSPYGGGGSSGIYNNLVPLVISGGGGSSGTGVLDNGGNACANSLPAGGDAYNNDGSGGHDGIGGITINGGYGENGNGGNGGGNGGYGGGYGGNGGTLIYDVIVIGGGGGYGGGSSGSYIDSVEFHLTGGGAGGSYVIGNASNISYATSTNGGVGVAGNNGYITITYTTDISCFLPNCDILLFSGIYKNITLLDISDEVMGYFSNKPQKIIEIIKNTIEISNLEDTNIPYLIEKSTFGNNCPDKDITISGHHRVVLKTEYGYNCVQAYKLNLKPSTSDIACARLSSVDIACARLSSVDIACARLPTRTSSAERLRDSVNISQALSPTGDIVVDYFHVKLQNQDEALIVNNLPLESYR